MESQKTLPESPATHPAMTSCRKKNSDDNASFLADVRDHIGEFLDASMDEHKNCFKKTIGKMFRMSKIVAEKDAGAKEVQSVMPLKTTLID